jgi:hypothetical protein
MVKSVTSWKLRKWPTKNEIALSNVQLQTTSLADDQVKMIVGWLPQLQKPPRLLRCSMPSKSTKRCQNRSRRKMYPFS